MYVCVCSGITDRQIVAAVEDGVCSVDELGHVLGVGICCGRCKPCAKALVDETLTALDATALVAA
jgi:bacterioferritin-associated ferredoxin